jgi:hypothetical protein
LRTIRRDKQRPVLIYYYAVLLVMNEDETAWDNGIGQVADNGDQENEQPKIRCARVPGFGNRGTLVEIEGELWLLGGTIKAMCRAGVLHGVLKA